MNYLLDTCVLSEFTRPRPDRRLILWLDSVDEERLFLSVITIGEIQRGIARLPECRRKTELFTWMNDALLERFTQRIVELDARTMLLWGSLTADAETSGHPLPVMDSLIAASALRHDMAITTRNVVDYLPCGVQVANPWE